MKILILSVTFITITSLTTIAQTIKKCDGTVLTGMSEKAGSLTEREIRDFLLTFGKECRNNVEFGEWSNELLFLVLDKQTLLALRTIEKAERQLELSEILSELSSPIHDGIDVRSLIKKVEQVKIDERLKKQILDNLRTADENMNPR
jgi:hypothetical protein